MWRIKFSLLVMVAIILVGCINIPIGDGNSIKLSKDGVTVSDEAGNETDIDYDEESLSITGGSGEEEFNVNVGASSELPKGFPDEVPIVDDATIIQTGDMSEGNEQYYMITYTSKKPIENIKDLYRNYIREANYIDLEGVYDTDELFEEADMYQGMVEDEKYFNVSIFEEADSDGGEMVMVSITYATMQ